MGYLIILTGDNKIAVTSCFSHDQQVIDNVFEDLDGQGITTSNCHGWCYVEKIELQVL